MGGVRRPMRRRALVALLLLAAYYVPLRPEAPGRSDDRTSSSRPGGGATTSTTHHHYDLAVLLRTGSQNSTARVESIRRTWASGMDGGGRMLTVMHGNERCRRKYGDNHWEGLTCLEAVMHVELMNRNDISFAWLLVVDDDTYVFVERLARLVRTLDPERRAAYGVPGCGDCGGGRAGFCGGGGYFLSRRNLLRMVGLRKGPVLPSMAHAFVDHFLQDPDRVWCDVRFACVAQDAGLELVHQPGMHGNRLESEAEEEGRIQLLVDGEPPPLVFHNVRNASHMERIHGTMLRTAARSPGLTDIFSEPEWVRRCPTFPETDVEALRWRMQHGPPISTQRPIPHKSDGHVYLFIICWPYQGSTVLMNLVASSPQTSDMCLKKGHFACEGHELLYEAGLLPELHWRTLSSPNAPGDWNEAVGAYSQLVWNVSKRVLMDKTPGNVHKVGKIYRDLLQHGKRAVFLLLTRSPCDKKFHGPGGMELVKASKSVPAESLLHVRYEDLLRDPYGQSQRIVDFVPELEVLDPAVSALSWKLQGARGKPLVEYAIEAALVLRNQTENTTAQSTQPKSSTVISPEMLEYAHHFGYYAGLVDS